MQDHKTLPERYDPAPGRVRLTARMTFGVACGACCQEAQVRCICLRGPDRLITELFNIMDIMFVGASAGATEDIIPPPLCYIAEKTAL